MATLRIGDLHSPMLAVSIIFTVFILFGVDSFMPSERSVGINVSCRKKRNIVYTRVCTIHCLKLPYCPHP